jgi:hypothetical protein
MLENAIREFQLPHGMFHVEKYFCINPKTGLYERTPFEIIEFPNAYVNVGGALLLDKLIGGSGTVLSNANANIGIGDSSTATAAGQTDLQAASNKTYKAMDATFPSRSGQVMSWRSTFATGDANYAWNEMALFNGNNPPTAIMLCRGVSSMGTKTSAAAWVATYTITVP